MGVETNHRISDGVCNWSKHFTMLLNALDSQLKESSEAAPQIIPFSPEAKLSPVAVVPTSKPFSPNSVDPAGLAEDTLDPCCKQAVDPPAADPPPVDACPSPAMNGNLGPCSVGR